MSPKCLVDNRIGDGSVMLSAVEPNMIVQDEEPLLLAC